MNVRVFYASGPRGKNIVLDGKGVPLPRGWYVQGRGSSYRVRRGGLFGPYSTKREANYAAWGTWYESKA